MSFISRVYSHPMARLVFAGALVLCLAPMQPRPLTAADDVMLAPPPLIRKFPENFFCPFPIDLPFTANATSATIHATANIYVNSSGSFLYTHQGIDNIFVVTDADYIAHTAPNTGSYNFCYQDANLPSLFLFDQQDLGTAKLAEKFATDAAAWELSQGAYYDNTKSGDNDPSSSGSHNSSGGCLGLGLENGSPSLADSARTQVVVSSLIVGQVYHVTGWWTVGDGIFTNTASLTIKVTGQGVTPVAVKTWGAMKKSYR